MNTNKLFSEFSLKKIWEKLSQHDKAMNSTLLILTSGNWVEQEDGTFTNTVPYSTFKETDKLTVDLYDDGTITETALSEYEVYIDEFDIVNGALIATANTKPTQTMTIVVKGDFESTEINISDMLRRLDEMESNFTMAASAIGDALVAKEIEVPEGTSLLEMADIINNTGSLSPKVTIIYQIESTEYYSEKVSKGDPVLSPTTFIPAKSGWTFVGWRKDRTASSEILSNELAESAMTLYAVFEQTVTCTFTSYSNTKTVTGKRYYNNGNIANASVTVPTNAAMSGWTWRGWSSAGVTTGNASVAYANGATISDLTANATYYGLYSITITLSYSGNSNTGGSTTAQTGTRYWNASGTYVNPSFTLKTNGFTKTNYAFVKWAQGSTSGTQYAAGASVSLTANTTFYAIWKPTTQTGKVYVSMWDRENKTFPVTFPQAFTAVPTVTYTITNTDASNNWSHFTVSVESLTKTGCVIRVKGDGDHGKGTGGYINWTAKI